jgi:hypothetical protein
MKRKLVLQKRQMRSADDNVRYFGYSELNKQFKRQQDDRNWLKDGGSIYFAADTSVIMAMISLAVSADPLHGIFREGPETRSGVCSLLAMYLKQIKETTGKPLILIEPTDRELSGTLNKIFSSAKDVDSEANALAEALKSGTTVDDSSLYDVISRILLSMHLISGPLVETYRAKALLESDLLVRLETYLEEGYSPFHLACLKNKPLYQEKFSFALEKLNKIRPVMRSGANYGGRLAFSVESNNSVDAQVLAKLEMLNLQWQDAGTKNKLILLTLDNAVEKTALDISFLNSGSLANFAIRSPICFLEDIDFFNIANVRSPSFIGSRTIEAADPTFKTLKSRTRFSDWIEVYFGEFADRGSLSKASIERLGDKLPDVDVAWQRYIQSIRSLSSVQEEWVNKQIIDTFNRLTNEDSNTAATSLEALKKKLDVVSQSAADAWGLDSVIAGFWALDLNSAKPIRAIPPINSYTFHELTKLSEKLEDRTQIKHLQSDRDDIFEKLEHEDPTRYTTLIWLSLVFCAADEWDNAYSVSKGAYNLARTRSSLGKNPKGDEAAYLCAVFNCLSARSCKDLEASESWLAQAERLQKENPSKPRADIVDIRFRSERYTLELAKIFGVFAETNKLPDFVEHCLIAQRCRDLLDLATLAATLQQIHVSLYVQRQCLVNALQWGLIPVDGDLVDVKQFAMEALCQLEEFIAKYSKQELAPNGLTATLLAFGLLRRKVIRSKISRESFMLEFEACKLTAESDKRSKIFYHTARLELFVRSMTTSFD